MRAARRLAGLVALAGLAGCAAEPPSVAPAASVRPQGRVEAPPVPEAPAPDTRSDASRALETFYRQLQADLLAQGLLRSDGGGPDTPFTDTMLARNFVRIALFDEYRADGATLTAQATISRLRRWEQPIAMNVEFGASVPEAQRVADRNAVLSYARRLSGLTGVPIRKEVAMTGEVTLRGRVLGIGGLKEKLLAALRGGIKTVLIPQENEKDLAELPDNVKNGLEIIPVEHVSDVLKLALVSKPEPIEWDEAAEEAAAQAMSKDNGGASAIAH